MVASSVVGASTISGQIRFGTTSSGTFNTYLTAMGTGSSAAGQVAELKLDAMHPNLAGGEVTYVLLIGPSAAGTVTVNGTAGARRFGGGAGSTLLVEEIMS